MKLIGRAKFTARVLHCEVDITTSLVMSLKETVENRSVSVRLKVPIAVMLQAHYRDLNANLPPF